MEDGEVFFLGEEHTNCAKWSVMKTQLQVTFYGLNRLYLGLIIYVHTYMRAGTISEKRDYEFGEEWGGVCQRLWRKEKEERKVVIIL